MFVVTLAAGVILSWYGHTQAQNGPAPVSDMKRFIENSKLFRIRECPEGMTQEVWYDKGRLSDVWVTAPPSTQGRSEDEQVHDRLQAFVFVFDGNSDNLTSYKRFIDATILSGNLKYTIDPTQKPKAIDISGQIKGKPYTRRGIYQYDGDQLTLCMPFENQPRPTKFEHNPKAGATVTVLKRVMPLP